MAKTAKKQTYTRIPTKVSEEEFNEFFLPHLSMPKRGPKCKIGYLKLFNYILKLLYTGVQWKELPIDQGDDGKPEITYTVIYKAFARWSDDGSLEKSFDNSVKHLSEKKCLIPPY
jgi:hypothetical protein